ncbi:MAG: cyclic nucleotide-binding domain-containing protein, partial [Phycisphaerae bacterium]
MSEKKRHTSSVGTDVIDPDLAWLARTFGRANATPLTLRDIEAFHRAAEYAEYGPGSHLFREGDQASSCYLVRSGCVDLYR